jgi:hypothetical protein
MRSVLFRQCEVVCEQQSVGIHCSYHLSTTTTISTGLVMSQFLSDYVQYMLRPLPQHVTSRGIDVVPDLYSLTALWTGFFGLLFLLVPFSSRLMFPEWYRSLSDRKRKEFPSYVVCLVHHLALVPIAWQHVIQDFYRTEQELVGIEYVKLEAIVAPFCLGYLLSDTLCYAIPEALGGRLEYIVHHVMTVWLVVTTMYSSGHISRFIPHLLMSDTTNVFFNSAWLLRAAGYKDSFVVSVLEVAFAVAFLLCRVINMPFAFYAVATSTFGQSLGIARLCFVPIAGLQWFWFAKVVMGMRSRLTQAPEQDSKQE